MLETDGGDDTHFRLTIRPDALTGPVAITLTPVAEVAGLPLSGGLVAAARLEPEGLVLARLARLEATPAEAPTGALTGFQFHEEGEDLHRYPLTAGGTITFQLPHFSFPGAAVGTAADRANDGQPPAVADGGSSKALPVTIVSGWETGPGDLVLRRAFAQAFDKYEENTTIEIRHRPE